MRSWSAMVLAVSILAGCGGGDDAAPGADARTDVRISLDADGDGSRPASTGRLRCPSPTAAAACRALEALPASVLAPVSRDLVCTQVFGGPQIGRVVGRIRNRPVDATFTRRDGCEIDRYERVEPVLRLAR